MLQRDDYSNSRAPGDLGFGNAHDSPILPAKDPFVSVVLDDGRPVGAGHLVQAIHDDALPQSADFGNRLHRAADASEEREKFPARGGIELRFDKLVVDLVADIHGLETKGISMKAEAADQSVHRIKFCVSEKAHPEFKVSSVATRCIHARAGLFPEAAAPKR